MVAESAYQAYNPDNPKKRFRRQTPEHHDELETRDENHINGQDDDATAEKSWWLRQPGSRDWRRWQRKEDEASQAPIDHHGVGDQHKAKRPYNDPEQNKNQSLE